MIQLFKQNNANFKIAPSNHRYQNKHDTNSLTKFLKNKWSVYVTVFLYKWSANVTVFL